MSTALPMVLETFHGFINGFGRRVGRNKLKLHRSGTQCQFILFFIYILLTSSISSPVLLTNLLYLFYSTVCQDQGPKCADLALLRKCTEGDKRLWMLTNCPQSCGLCQGRADSKVSSFDCRRTKDTVFSRLNAPSGKFKLGLVDEVFSSLFRAPMLLETVFIHYIDNHISYQNTLSLL